MHELREDPFEEFRAWYKEASHAGEAQPDAVALATVSEKGQPSIRIVLHKGVSEGGFEFYTNYESQKGRELLATPYAALVFHWPKLQKQIRVEGPVEKMNREDSEAYFRTRPRGSQIGAWASLQSQVIPNREFLEKRVSELEAKYKDKDVPCPPHWGGFRLMPEMMEFWIGRESRLHDRFRYARNGKGWKLERLSP